MKNIAVLSTQKQANEFFKLRPINTIKNNYIIVSSKEAINGRYFDDYIILDNDIENELIDLLIVNLIDKAHPHNYEVLIKECLLLEDIKNILLNTKGVDFKEIHALDALINNMYRAI